MKDVLLAISLLCLVSCDDNEEPTTFRGEVVFPNGYENASKARVGIIGLKSRGVGTPIDNVIDSSLVLDENNHFAITLPAFDVQYYKVGIDILDTSGILSDVLLDGDGIECSPYGCNTLEPGKSYDLTIRIVE